MFQQVVAGMIRYAVCHLPFGKDAFHSLRHWESLPGKPAGNRIHHIAGGWIPSVSGYRPAPGRKIAEVPYEGCSNPCCYLADCRHAIPNKAPAMEQGVANHPVYTMAR